MPYPRESEPWVVRVRRRTVDWGMEGKCKGGAWSEHRKGGKGKYHEWWNGIGYK